MEPLEKDLILSALATSYSEDEHFLTKVNKLTFGLLKQDNLNNNYNGNLQNGKN